MIAYTEHERTA